MPPHPRPQSDVTDVDHPTSGMRLTRIGPAEGVVHPLGKLVGPGGRRDGDEDAMTAIIQNVRAGVHSPTCTLAHRQGRCSA